MKKIINMTIITLIMLAFSGCNGGADSSAASSASKSASEFMQKNKIYEVKRGDKIVKISQNPQLKIYSNLDTGKTEVELISGEAEIVRN